jgi:hypothetical protein
LAYGNPYIRLFGYPNAKTLKTSNAEFSQLDDFEAIPNCFASVCNEV